MAPLGTNYSDNLLGSTPPQLDADGFAFTTTAGPDFFSIWNDAGNQSVSYWAYSKATDIGQGGGSFTAEVQAVAEPSSIALMGVGGLGLLLLRRFRRPFINNRS